jgi:hypothetical protein
MAATGSFLLIGGSHPLSQKEKPTSMVASSILVDLCFVMYAVAT